MFGKLTDESDQKFPCAGERRQKVRARFWGRPSSASRWKKNAWSSSWL